MPIDVAGVEALDMPSITTLTIYAKNVGSP
jgi:hypothetical protein